MRHYDFSARFHSIYDKAVSLYAKGQRGAKTFFTPGEHAWLAANGLAAQHLYDYAEDQDSYDEPGYDNALGIELVRRDYFLNVQDGKPSAIVLDEATLPPKADAVRGVVWLPRLLPKTKAKLRGELPDSLMYSCGGDRAFFARHDIQSSEFLSLVWRHEHADAAVVDWVVRRTALQG
ncbi:MAG: DUF5069 domain-containing protein [Opitutaceae bacterium]|nr:DUF5069 domain-containing protein [Opitutaceae bacterium]